MIQGTYVCDSRVDRSRGISRTSPDVERQCDSPTVSGEGCKEGEMIKMFFEQFLQVV